MPDPVRDHVLRAFDDVFSHRWDSIGSALAKDLTSEEAVWQHPAYRQEPCEPGTPPPGSLFWQLAHLEGCAREYAGILSRRSGGKGDDAPAPRTFNLPALLEALRQSHARLRESIARISDADLTSPCEHYKNTEEFLRMVLRHSACMPARSPSRDGSTAAGT